MGFSKYSVFSSHEEKEEEKEGVRKKELSGIKMVQWWKASRRTW
jgi:hypothetical protein